MSIAVLGADVWWGDGYENAPTVSFVVDRRPGWEVFDKRPCERETVSTEQAAIVGRKPASMRARDAKAGWHVYWSEDDGFVTFFTWGGKPDNNGFGGWRRTVKLLNGGEEEIVGGWHVAPGVAVDAGLTATIDTSYRLDDRGGGLACFITAERFAREVAAHLPDVEVVGPTVKWRGQISKAEFMAAERVRRDALRDELKAKYHDGSWHGGEWYRKATDEERSSVACRPYSVLGPCD